MNEVRDFLRLQYLAAILLLSSASSTSLHSQTDSALGFFPLGPGDIWEYTTQDVPSCRPPKSMGYYEQWVEGDTVYPNGNHYWFVFSRWWPGFGLTRVGVRIDSTSANVYHSDGSGERLVDSLRSSAGDVRRIGELRIRCFAVDSDTVFGTVTKTKRFVDDNPFGESRTYSWGFGIVQRESRLWPEECPSEKLVYDLIYARVNGKEYGTYVSVSDRHIGLPRGVVVDQNYPNPFNPSTTIRYGLPNRSYVTLTVFNPLGQQVAVLQNGEQEAGYHEVKFDGSGLSSGVYFYRIQAGDFVLTRKLLILR